MFALTRNRPVLQHNSPAAATKRFRSSPLIRRSQQVRVRAEPDLRNVPPPPPPPESAFGGPNQSATPRFQDLSVIEFKERYLRPTYLPLSFTLGALTLGLRVASANYTFDNSPFEFLATAASTGLMSMSLAWVLFDFTDNPPPGGNFSSPRK